MKKYILIFFLFSFQLFYAQQTIADKIIEDHPKEYFKIGKYYKNMPQKDEESFKLLLNLSRNNNHALSEIYALNTLGLLERKKSNFRTSLAYHRKALKLALEEENIDAQLHSLNLLGITCRWQGDIRRALDYHQRALSIAQKDTSNLKNTERQKSISISYNSTGEIYKELKQYDLAVGEFLRAIEINEKIKDNRGLAVNYGSLGSAFYKLNKLDDAISSYYKSLSFNEKIDSNVGRVICNARIAEVLIDKGKYDEAESRVISVYDIAGKLKVKKYYALAVATLGYAQLKKRDLNAAEKNLIDARDLYEHLKVSDSDFIRLYTNISELYEEKGSYSKALFYYKEAIDQEHKTSGQQNILYVSNLISKYNLQSKNMKIKNLENQTKLQSFETSRTRNILIITLISLALLSVALYSIYHQRLLNNDKKVLSLEQQALQAQMNPHFVFNALNSIKLYIINNEQKQAVYYLNKFSKLIRNILDASKNKEVSLQEELETMDVYVTMENIRFNNEINYIKHIDENLKLDTIKVPPLILQPFIENSVWHGLSAKKGDKHIILSVKKVSQGILEISVEDNGIGRQLAMQVKKEKTKSLQRKSVGISLTKERLKTFSVDYTNESSVEYYDLTNPSGTKVVLRIPMV